MSSRQGIQIGFAAVGAVVGAYAGNPQLGYALGSVLGAVVANAALPPEPSIFEQESLADISVTAPSLGNTIPVLKGTFVLGGNIIWAYPKIEIEHTDVETLGGGKGGFGGPKQITKTKTYRVHMMVALCKGPVSRISRIYYDATLIYDEAQPGDWTVAAGQEDGDPGGPTENPATIIYKRVSEELEQFVLFRGTDEQEPWAFAESLDDVGAGEIPAYRGTAYVGVTLDLGISARVPNLRFETTTNDAALSTPVGMVYGANSDTIWAAYAAGLDPQRGLGRAIGHRADTLAVTEAALLGDSAEIESLDANVRPVRVAPCQTNGGYDAMVVQLQAGIFAVVNIEAGVLDIGEIDVRTAAEVTAETALGNAAIVARDDASGNATIIAYLLPDIDVLGEFETREGAPSTFKRLSINAGASDLVYNAAEARYFVACATAGTVQRIVDSSLTVDETITMGTEPTRLLVASDNNCWVTDRAGAAVYRFTDTADKSAPVTVGTSPDSITEATDTYIWVANTGATSVCRIEPTALTVETFTLPAAPTLVLGAIADGKCWALSQVARQLYLIDTDGTVLGNVQVPRGSSQMLLDAAGNCVVLSPTARTIVSIDSAVASATYVPADNGLACVVREICEEAGVPPEWIDVGGLDQRPVNFVRFGIGAAGLLLDLLATGYQFTFVESGNGLRFFFKGGTAIASIPENALSAQSDQALAEGLGIERQQQLDLPTEVTVVYPSPQRNYNDDEQTASLTTSEPRNPVTIQLPVAFPDPQEVRDLAQVMLYEPRFARNPSGFHLPPAGMLIEPADIVQVTSRGTTHLLRVTQLTLGQRGDLEVNGVRHRSYLYEDFAGFPGESSHPTTLERKSPVDAVYVDAPPLDISDTGLRFFVAVGRNTLGDAFPAVAVFESLDGEATYNAQLLIISEATIGDVATAAAEGIVHTWDTSTTIDVVLRSPDRTLNSAADAAVLAGTANLCQIGAEVIGFATATLIAARTYRLSRLLRGRRGTEQFVGTHANGEPFVLLNTTLRTSAARTYSAPGQVNYYKTVPNGSDVSLETGEAFTPQGVSVRPWAPRIAGLVRDPATGDFVLTWWHRSRLDGALKNFGGIAWDPDDLRDYTIAVYADSDYGTVQQTYTTPIESSAEGARTYTYTAAAQAADFGGAQVALYIGIRQRVAGVQGLETRASNIADVDLPLFELWEFGLTIPETVTEGFE